MATSPALTPPIRKPLSPFAQWVGLAVGAGMSGGATGVLVATHTPANVVAWLSSLPQANLDYVFGAGCLTALTVGGWGVGKIVALKGEVDGWREAYRQIQRTATIDPITNLNNQAGLEAKAALSLARMHRGHGPVSMLVVRIGGVGAMSATVLNAIGDRLVGTVRRSDVVARLDSGEFAILAELRTPEDAAILGERINGELSVPVPGVSAKLSARIGIAIAPDDADSAPTLLQRAMQASESPIGEGEPIYRFFSRDMQTRSKQREELRQMVIEAVAHGQITLNYQPVVDLASRKIVGFEAMARWAPPGRRQIPPSFFFPAAEDSGVIGMLTDQLLTQACTAAASWPDDQRVILSLSPRQMRDKMLTKYIKHALDSSHLPGSRLELELTEDALRDDLPLVRETLLKIKNMGVRIALDDSALGATTIAALQSIPFDRIKICSQRTAKPAEGSEAAMRLETLMATVKAMSIPVLVDTIETEEDAATAGALGCALAQGWWFGHPIPADYVKAIFSPARF